MTQNDDTKWWITQWHKKMAQKEETMLWHIIPMTQSDDTKWWDKVTAQRD